MEPADITILAIQNPGDAEATIANPQRILTPNTAIEQYGGQIKQGAFVTLTDRSVNGNTVSVTTFVADRIGDTLYLQNNAGIAENEVSIDSIGGVEAQGYAPPEPELETFTVFGNNDDGENFVAVVSATEDTVVEEGVKAGLVDEGYEADVTIAAVLKGDQSGLERVSV